MKRSIDRLDDEVLLAELTVRVFVDSSSGMSEDDVVDARDSVASDLEEFARSIASSMAAHLPSDGWRAASQVVP